jgi:hypothetical protein
MVSRPGNEKAYLRGQEIASSIKMKNRAIKPGNELLAQSMNI